MSDTEKRTGPLLTQLDHLLRFSSVVGSTMRVDMLLEDALDPLCGIAGADGAFVYLLPSGESTEPVCRFSGSGWQCGEVSVTAGDIDAMGTELLVIAHGKGMPRAMEAVVGERHGEILIVPLWAYGRPVGVVVVASDHGAFDAATKKLVAAVGSQMALGVANARLFAELEMSYHHLLYTQEEMIRNERVAAVSALAATMAHEIRNPLATIFSSLSQVRKHAQIEGDSATLLRIAEEEAVRMNRMVSGLLEYARPGVPRFEATFVMEPLREVVRSSNPLIEKKGEIELKMEASREDIQAELDVTLFKKAMHHVIDNALSAVNPGDGRISIRVEEDTGTESDAGLPIVVITVTDNGKGAAREIHNRVFEPFFSTKPAGLGLGLSTVMRIVTDHGGKVTFASSEKQGTTVRMTFRSSTEGSSAGTIAAP